MSGAARIERMGRPPGSGKLASHAYFFRTAWEGEPIRKLVSDRQVMSCWHNGFWQAMDTLRERNILQQLWETGRAPWKLWES